MSPIQMCIRDSSMGLDFEYVIGWDFNYFTFDFFPYGVSAANTGKDACFIRCVETVSYTHLVS